MNYFTVECRHCKSTQGGWSSLEKDNAILHCKKCKRSSKLKNNDRPDGSYVWYFGSSLQDAQDILKLLKRERKR